MSASCLPLAPQSGESPGQRQCEQRLVFTLPASACSVRRVREKYEAELSELEQSERKLQERCTELKGRLGEAEGEKERLQSLVRQKEKELEDLRAVSSPGSFCIGVGVRELHPAFLLTVSPSCQVNTQMCSERASLAQVVRREFADQLAASQEENQRVKVELAELRARQQVELDEVHRRWVVSTAGRGQGTLLSPPNKQVWPWGRSSHGLSLCQEG